MTAVAQGWLPLARRLADGLAERGALHDAEWRAALTEVPRHALVPSFYTQTPDFGWREVTAADPGYLTEVYRNQPLVTSLSDHGDGTREPESSSSQPSLMIRMLETLGVTAGQRVLEIGTGTGYNAALMAHRLGADSVFSVDIDDGFIERARERLGRLGIGPRLATADGAHGWPAHAPYDKIIATCSVPAIPWRWAGQLAVGGQLLVDVKIGQIAGNLVLLHRYPDRLEGRFVPGWASFMEIRQPGERLTTERHGPRFQAGVARTTTAGPEPWRNLVPWFAAHFAYPDRVGHGVTLDPGTRQPVATFLTAPDGSWCEVRHAAVDGHYAMTEYGPTALWACVENADRWWREAGEPGWERLGLTVTEREQFVWLDTPAGPDQWMLGSGSA